MDSPLIIAKVCKRSGQRIPGVTSEEPKRRLHLHDADLRASHTKTAAKLYGKIHRTQIQLVGAANRRKFQGFDLTAQETTTPTDEAN